MHPELHVKKFLEEAKDRYTRNIYKDVCHGLNYYLQYLKCRKKKTIHVQAEVFEAFKKHLYSDRCHNANTVLKYLRGLRDFYESLAAGGLIKKVHLEYTRPQKPPLRNRSYTNDEILRAYRAHWRGMNASPIHRTRGLKFYWPKIRDILGDLRLQNLERKDLDNFCNSLDQYPSTEGKILCKSTREHSLGALKCILRWMYRNGYIREDITRGYKYPFKSLSGEVLLKDPIDPLWQAYQERFFNDVQGRWRPGTIALGKRYIKSFFLYLSEQKVQDIHQISLELLEEYRSKLYSRKDLAETTKHSKLGFARYFMNYLEKTGQILINPARQLYYPKRSKGLPTRLMSHHEVMTLISAPDEKSPYGLRDRALFELMYSTGTRVGEATSLKLEDIDFEQGLVRIENAKGGPDYQRVVPIGSIALGWIKKYRVEARSEFMIKPGYERYVFLSKGGGPLSAAAVNARMYDYALKQGMRKIYSSHSWRVTCATAMLKNRADIRYVQEQLGHRCMDSTRRYTRLMPMDLKKVHEKTHPRERDYRKLAKSQRS